MTQRPFRFGAQAYLAPDRKAWCDIARKAEDAGFDVLTMPDHFNEQFAPVPALMAAADATTSLRVGALVWDNDYRHPVVLAKELATLDVLTDGRLEVGLGAGWMTADYEASGIPYDPPRVRLDRFEEGYAIIDGAFRSGPFSLAGKHYTVTAYEGVPKPRQQPRPPILIGGGSKRVLTFAARNADIVGISGSFHEGVIGMGALQSMSAASVDEKLAIVRAAAGERMDAIELNIRVFMVNITDDRDGALELLTGAIGVERSLIEESPFALIGPPEQLIEDLLARRERWGLSYVVVGADDIDRFAPVVAALAGS